MANRFKEAAAKAADITNKQLSDELAVVTQLSRDSIRKLLPRKSDKEAFIKLMAEVEADTTMDEKVTFLQDNIKSVGSVAITLLKALV